MPDHQKSAVHCKFPAVVKFAAHLSTSEKRQLLTNLCLGLYITYRAIHDIGLYNWHLQDGSQILRYCIAVYLYRAIHQRCGHTMGMLYTYMPIGIYMV